MEIGLRDWRDKRGERPRTFFTRGTLAELAQIFGCCAILSGGGLICARFRFFPVQRDFISRRIAMKNETAVPLCRQMLSNLNAIVQFFHASRPAALGFLRMTPVFALRCSTGIGSKTSRRMTHLAGD